MRHVTAAKQTTAVRIQEDLAEVEDRHYVPRGGRKNKLKSSHKHFTAAQYYARLEKVGVDSKASGGHLSVKPHSRFILPVPKQKSHRQLCLHFNSQQHEPCHDAAIRTKTLCLGINSGH